MVPRETIATRFDVHYLKPNKSFVFETPLFHVKPFIILKTHRKLFLILRPIPPPKIIYEQIRCRVLWPIACQLTSLRHYRSPSATRVAKEYVHCNQTKAMPQNWSRRSPPLIQQRRRGNRTQKTVRIRKSGSYPCQGQKDRHKIRFHNQSASQSPILSTHYGVVHECSRNPSWQRCMPQRLAK